MARTRGKRQLPTAREAACVMGKRVAPVRVRPFGIPDALLLFLSGALLLLIFFSALLPRLLGYVPYAVTSDSMAPTLARGDLIFAAPVSLDELEGGEIVAFRTAGGAVTHRVYSVDAASRTLRTKADASIFLDASPVEEGDLLGRVVYKLPLLGYISLSFGGKGASS